MGINLFSRIQDMASAQSVSAACGCHTGRIIFSLRAAIWQAITMDLAVSWKKAFP